MEGDLQYAGQHGYNANSDMSFAVGFHYLVPNVVDNFILFYSTRIEYELEIPRARHRVYLARREFGPRRSKSVWS